MPKRQASRSRSPRRSDRSHRDQDNQRHRSGSPHRDGHHHHRSAREKKTDSDKRYETQIVLPLGAKKISKHDLHHYRPMFALYLDIQKSLDIDDLNEDEVRGRWKSFVGKWNRGELAEGWYDPNTLSKALAAEHENIDEEIRHTNRAGKNKSRETGPNEIVVRDADGGGSDGEDDEFGPPLPTTGPGAIMTMGPNAQRSGPVIPNVHDLRNRDEQSREDADAARDERIANLRAERKVDRKLQKERLDDLTPRADAGSRERILENKRIAADSNRAFAAAAGASGDVELKDSEVMGEEDSFADLKRMKRENERKKNEREIRREEIRRARMAEREERVKGLKAKEDKTMEMLRRIAHARFGGGDPNDAGLEQG